MGQVNQPGTHIGIGAANGGTSPGRYDDAGEAQSSAEQRCHPVFQLARRACSQQLAQNQAQVEGSHVDHVADFASHGARLGPLRFNRVIQIMRLDSSYFCCNA
jgi:hypothetical protein